MPTAVTLVLCLAMNTLTVAAEMRHIASMYIALIHVTCTEEASRPPPPSSPSSSRKTSPAPAVASRVEAGKEDDDEDAAEEEEEKEEEKEGIASWKVGVAYIIHLMRVALVVSCVCLRVRVSRQPLRLFVASGDF